MNGFLSFLPIAGVLLLAGTSSFTPQDPYKSDPQDTRKSSQSQYTSHDKAPMSDADIMKKIAVINSSEIALGKLATEHGTAGFGKTYGQMMVTDHTKAEDELKALASSENVTLSEGMDSTHQAVWSNLSSMSGRSFDKSYCKAMKVGHEKVLMMFMKWKDQATDSGLKAYIEKYEPVVRHHMEEAMEWSAGAMSGDITGSWGD